MNECLSKAFILTRPVIGIAIRPLLKFNKDQFRHQNPLKSLDLLCFGA